MKIDHDDIPDDLNNTIDDSSGNLSEQLDKIISRPKITKHGRNYKCPKCGGEFNQWDEKEERGITVKEVCPFCGLERGEYDESDEDSSMTVGADTDNVEIDTSKNWWEHIYGRENDE